MDRFPEFFYWPSYTTYLTCLLMKVLFSIENEKETNKVKEHNRIGIM
jgi:hypothetical protein